MFDREEFERWMAQASDILNSARQDHSIVKLLNDLETYIMSKVDLVSCARTLDRHYVPARIRNFCSINGKKYE